MAGYCLRSAGFKPLSRSIFRAGLAALLLLAGARSVHDASAVGDTRTLSFHHTHSNEDLTVTFKRNGRYDEDGLKTLNHFLRDWRSQDQTTMNRHLFDILWEVYRDVDGKQPIQIVSAYRSPATNAMLHRRSSGVARYSQHMLGNAMDFFIPGAPLEQIRFAGLRLQRGGVGFYPESGSPFVHLDTGSVRHWPRMTHDQLARVFPKGRTVHVPSDGNPLPGYELALADVERRRDKNDDSTSQNSGQKPGLFAALFSGKQQQQADDDEENSGNQSVAVSSKPTLLASATAKIIEKNTETIPLPRAKPAATKSVATYQVTSAAPEAVKIINPPAKASSEQRPQTPADIINARGFWGHDNSSANLAQIAALKARGALAALPSTPASLSPNVAGAMAYAPATSLDRAQLVTGSITIPGTAISGAPVVLAATNPILPSAGQRISTANRMSGVPQKNDVWMRAMILAPSATTSLSSTTFGNQDIALMRAHFIKPQKAIAITFTSDPQMGLVSERFTGSAIAALSTVSFVIRTASLR